MKTIGLMLFFFIFVKVYPQTKNTWDCTYPGDKFNGNALLDLRDLNEKYAGEHGFLKLSLDGNSFVRGDGEPIRFWAANISGGMTHKNLNHLDSLGRFLSKMGFNMARFHGSINPRGENSKLHDADTAEIERIWRFVAAMKKNGIYSTISPFWAHNGHMGGNIPKEWGIEGYSGNDGLWGVMYFNDKLKDAYKSWVKQLYTQVNPYTGIAMKDDPAVGIIQIKNEDGVFFWTMQDLNPELKKLIQLKYAAWLTKKYGSLSAACAKWGNEAVEGDDWINKIPGLYSIYDMTLEQSGNKSLRIKDQVQFYAETQYDFYKEIHDYYRDTLGCKQLINPNNWRTASTPRLNDPERWTNSSCEVIATNRYMDPQHFGEDCGWQIRPGHFYVGASVLKSPELLPINMKQVIGHPMMITESAWNMPNKHQAEGPFLIAAYQSLTGVDAFYWFCVEDIGFSGNPYFDHLCTTDSTCAMQRWNISSPGGIGMMPANALIYRLNYLKEGETVIHEERTPESLFNREIPFISEEAAFDPNRDTGFLLREKADGSGYSPLAFLAGKVEVNYNGIPENTSISKNLDQCIKTQIKTVISSTNELIFDYGSGICTINSPYSQGVCGFLNAKKHFIFKDVKIQSTNEYASIQVVSMDQKPLKQSEKLFIQVGTSYLPTAWKETPADFEADNQKLTGFRINSAGRMPWQGQNIDVTIEISNPSLSGATLLDAAGYPVKNIPVKKLSGGIQITLPADAMYVIIN